MKALSKALRMQKKFNRVAKDLGLANCQMLIQDYSEEHTQTEFIKGMPHKFTYPATIDIKFENWSNSFFSLRVSDCTWVAEGNNQSKPGKSGYRVLREQIKELQDFRNSLATSKSQIVWIK